MSYPRRCKIGAVWVEPLPSATDLGATQGKGADKAVSFLAEDGQLGEDIVNVHIGLLVLRVGRAAPLGLVKIRALRHPFHEADMHVAIERNNG